MHAMGEECPGDAWCCQNYRYDAVELPLWQTQKTGRRGSARLPGLLGGIWSSGLVRDSEVDEHVEIADAEVVELHADGVICDHPCRKGYEEWELPIDDPGAVTLPALKQTQVATTSADTVGNLSWHEYASASATQGLPESALLCHFGTRVPLSERS